MKILFLTLSGSMETLASRGIYTDLLRYFRQKGHYIYVAFPYERRLHKKTSLHESDRYHALGIRTLNITKTNYVEKGIGTVLLGYQYVRNIKRYWSDVKFDIILFSTPPNSFNKIVKDVKTRTGAKSYLLQKDFFLQGAVDLGVIRQGSLIYKLYKSQEEELYKISDYIGCMSEANVKFLLARYPHLGKHQVEICPNSIEVTKDKSSVDIKSIKEKYNIPLDVPIFIYGGNLGKPQGIDFIIKVLESNKLRKDCFFCIIGSGTEFKKLATWYKSSKPKNVIIHPALPKNDYDKIIKAADVGLIFLDHRFTEPNFPSRILSYLENKMPILSSTDRATDIGELIEHNSIGYSSYSDDIDDFNRKLDRILSEMDSWKVMGQNGYNYLLENFQVSSSYEIIMKHFV